MAKVRVPKVGMSATEVEILELFVQPGQRLRTGDPVAEVGADKVDFTIEADVDGVVSAVMVSPGDVCEVGSVLVEVEDPPAS